MSKQLLGYFLSTLLSVNVFAGGGPSEWLGPDKVLVDKDAYCVGPELSLKFIEPIDAHKWRVHLVFNRGQVIEEANVYYDGLVDHIQIYSTSDFERANQNSWGIFGNDEKRYSLIIDGDLIIDRTIDCAGLHRP